MIADAMPVVRRLAVASALLTIPASSAPAQDSSDVDLALVLAVDASGSIDDSKFALQREGIAEAITDPQVFAAIKAGHHGQIAVTLVQWGTPGAPEQIVRWHIIGNTERAADFAYDVRRGSRADQTSHALGDGMELGVALIAACPCRPARRVIDVSGNNPDSRSQVPAPAARDEAVRDGITVNALAILNDDRKGPSGRPWLVEVYEKEVVGGPGAFVATAETLADFAKALRQKLIQEIASR